MEPEEEQVSIEDEQKAFEAAFEGNEPTPEPEPAEEPEEPEAPEAPAEEPEAPAEALTPDQERIQQLESRLRSTEAKYGGLNSQLQQLVAAGRAAPTTVPAQTDIAEALGDGEKFKQLKADWPEYAEAMEEAFGKVPQVDADGIMSKLAGAVDQKLEGVTQNIVLLNNHRDWKDVINTEAFKNWTQQQTPEVQALASSDDPYDAVDMISQYKDSVKQRKENQTKQDRRLEESVTPTKGNSVSKSRKTKSDEEDFLESYKTG